MNDNQINLLKSLRAAPSGFMNTGELARMCKLENSCAAYQLCGLRDLGYVVSDTKNQRSGGFATWSITVSGHNFMYARKAALIASFSVPYGSVAPTLSADQATIQQLRASLAALSDDFTYVSDKLRDEKSINAELNGLVKELRTKLSSATAVKPVSDKHYFAVISQLQGSYATKVVERFVREDAALRAAESYAQKHNTETVSVCESKHLIQLEQVINVKAVAKLI